jgi:hypothetical protein
MPQQGMNRSTSANMPAANAGMRDGATCSDKDKDHADKSTQQQMPQQGMNRSTSANMPAANAGMRDGATCSDKDKDHADKSTQQQMPQQGMNRSTQRQQQQIDMNRGAGMNNMPPSQMEERADQADNAQQ